MTPTNSARRGQLRCLAVAVGTQLRGWQIAAPALGLAMLAGSADAATFTVTNLNDSGAGSLRQAITDANADAVADSIEFQAGLTGTIVLTTGVLFIGEPLTITGLGRGSTTISGNASSRIFDFSPSTPGDALSLADMDLVGGNAAGQGGAIIVNSGALSLTAVGISNSFSGASGGAVSITGNLASLSLVDCEVSGNTATLGGGGVHVYLGRPLSITASTFANNSASVGGGLFVERIDQNVSIVNSTFSGNAATTGVGGGMAFGRTGTGGTLDHCTIAGNTATDVGGGVFFGDPGLAGFAPPPRIKGGGIGLTVTNSLFADNGTSDDMNGDGFTSSDPDIAYTLIETVGTGFSFTNSGNNMLATDPQLGALQNNGGPTRTILPASTSQAIDAADLTFGGTPATDQRGLDRVNGGARDMGAVEFTPGQLDISPTTLNVTEGVDPVASFSVVRSGGSDGAISIDYATADGSAIAPGDYTAASGTLNWASGDTADKSADITIVDDALIEADENYSVAIANPQGGATLGTATSQTVTIVSDDVFVAQPGTLAFDPASYTVAENGGSVQLTVTRSGGSDGAVSVQCDSVQNGTATADSDYTTTSTTLNWINGDTSSKTCTIALLDDTLDEPDETFGAALGNATGGATLGIAAASVTITDNDIAGTIQLSASSYDLAEGPGGVAKALLLVNAMRIGGSDGAISVDYATSDGTATQPGDYLPASGTLNWAHGDSANKTIAIIVNEDDLQEPAETFGLALTNPQGGAGLGAPASAVITIPANGFVGTAPQIVPATDLRALALLLGGFSLIGTWALRRRFD